MPRYDPKRIEPKWQRYWDEHQTFATPDDCPGSAEALRARHVSLPIGRRPARRPSRRATPPPTSSAAIRRMRGQTCCTRWAGTRSGCPPSSTPSKPARTRATTTEKNIDTFRRQIKMLGFSYDWDREVDTTDPDYFRWTQWIFLMLFDTWYDRDAMVDGWPQTQGRGRPIAELPIPADVARQGREAVRRYQDKQRLAYQSRGAGQLVPGAGHGAGQRRSHRRQERARRPSGRAHAAAAMDAADHRLCRRLLDDLDELDWPESIKAMQRNWIGRSEGAEVDFFIGTVGEASTRQASPHGSSSGPHRLSAEPGDDVLRSSPRGPTRSSARPTWCWRPSIRWSTAHDGRAASRRSSSIASRPRARAISSAPSWPRKRPASSPARYAINPVNGEADSDLDRRLRAGQLRHGAIMAVPAHDERDFEFARQFGLPIVPVVAAAGRHEPLATSRR